MIPSLLPLLLVLAGCPRLTRRAEDASPSDSAYDGPAPRDAGATRVDAGTSTTDAGSVTIGWCMGTCATDADCCPDDSSPCGEYPYNSRCLDGLCQFTGCAGDSDCGDLYACLSIEGYAICRYVCRDDTECDPWAECRPSEDGRKTCALWSCTEDWQCCLGQDGCGRVCGADGQCYCTDDASCYAAWQHCVGGRCQCLTDEDCASSVAWGIEHRCVQFSL